MADFKRPVSVLVVIHTPDLEVLLLERASFPGFWQSVTGSQEGDESLVETAQREVAEETGIIARTTDFKDWQITNTFEIYPQWRHRYAPGVTSNIEHVFSLKIPEKRSVRIAVDEHTDQCWLPWSAAAEKCFSWSNKEAILKLPEHSPKR